MTAIGGAPAGAEGLVECQCDLEAADYEGRKPLEVACAHGHLQTIEKLVELGASLKGRGRRGRSPLHATADRYRPAALDLLISMGADANAVDDDGRTALHHAAYWGYGDIVMQLVGHGARCTEDDEEGTALMQALKRAQYVLNADAGTIGEILGCADENIDENELQQRALSAFEEKKLSLITHLASKLESKRDAEGPDCHQLPRYKHHKADDGRTSFKQDSGALRDASPRPETATSRGSWATADTEAAQGPLQPWCGQGHLEQDTEPEEAMSPGMCNPLDERSQMYCQHQRGLWAMYICAQDRLSKGTAGKYVSEAVHPEAKGEVARGLVALKRIRDVMEFAAKRDLAEQPNETEPQSTPRQPPRMELPEPCPVTSAGSWHSAVPEKLIEAPIVDFK